MTCRRGHPLDDANVYTTPDGYGRCRTCIKAMRAQRAIRYSSKAVGVVKPCVENAYGKCWCGATLKTQQDADLHNCDRRLLMVLGRQQQVVTGVE